MRTLILIASLAATLAFGVLASANAQRNCTTQCFRNFNGSQTCFTSCS